VLQATPVSERRGKGQEDDVAARHKGVRKTIGFHLEFDVAGQRRLGDLAECLQSDGVVVAKAAGPARAQVPQVGDPLAAVEFDAMALAVVEADRLDMIEAVERPGKTRRRVLAAREENKCSIAHTPASLGMDFGLAAIVLGPALGSFVHSHARELWQLLLDAAPDPTGDVLRRRVLQAAGPIQAMVVEPLQHRPEGGLDVEEIDDKPGLWVSRSFELQLHTIGVPVHAMALVRLGHSRQPVCGLEGEGLSDFHGIPMSLWVWSPRRQWGFFWQ
jgi:hypothetical protein